MFVFSAAYFNDIVVGGVCCRVEMEGEQKRLYIMTLGVLAPYRRLGVGECGGVGDNLEGRRRDGGMEVTSVGELGRGGRGMEVMSVGELKIIWRGGWRDGKMEELTEEKGGMERRMDEKEEGKKDSDVMGRI